MLTWKALPENIYFFFLVPSSVSRLLEIAALGYQKESEYDETRKYLPQNNEKQLECLSAQVPFTAVPSHRGKASPMSH